jgi:hypothetical protein
MVQDYDGLTLRPYQLLCSVCSLGAREPEELLEDTRYVRAGGILAAIAGRPDVPITLRCQAGFIYSYQDPGSAEDTPEGSEYNRKRDLDILQRLDLPPGTTLPARTLFKRVLSRIPLALGICGYREITAPAWRGCAKTLSGNYERGVDRGIDAIVAPRDEALLACQKVESARALYAASELAIRPHILMCNVCNYGGRLLRGEQLPLEPIAADNVIEFLDRVLTDPTVPVVLVKGADPVICAPCPQWVPELQACANVTGSGGLSNEKRDMDTLQQLGLTYGTRMAGGALYKLLFERIPTNGDICTRDNPIGMDRQGSVWDSCGYQAIRTYEAGRLLLMERFGCGKRE